MKRLAISLLVVGLIMPLSASSIQDKKQQLDSAEQHITDKKAQVTANKQEQNRIYTEMKKIDEEANDIQNEIKSLDKKLEDKKEEIIESQKKLDAATVKKENQYEATKKRMTQMYKNQDIGYLQIIFSSDNFWDAMNRIEYVKAISKKDDSLLDEYQMQIDTINTEKAKIEEDRDELDILQRSAIIKKEQLEVVKDKKQDLLDELYQEQDELNEQIYDLEKLSESIKAEINALIKKQEEEERRKNASSNSGGGSRPTVSSQYVGGTFMWPVPGYYRISSEYESRISPISGKKEFHTGIDIPANYGEDVVAAADGVVIHSGNINGFGNTIMINHGGGVVTLYGHNSSLVATNGQKVTKGQVVARIGSTGWSTGNHCHFEVRLNGEHTSPWPYLND